MKKFMCIFVILFSINASADEILEGVAEAFFESKNMSVQNVQVNDLDNPLGRAMDPDGERGVYDKEIFFKYRGQDKNCHYKVRRKRLEDDRIEYYVKIYDCGSVFLNIEPTVYEGKVYFDN